MKSTKLPLMLCLVFGTFTACEGGLNYQMLDPETGEMLEAPGQIIVDGTTPAQNSNNQTTPEPDPDPDPGAAVAEPFACDEQASREELPLRRLSHEQYINTVRDLLRASMPQDGQRIFDGLGDELSAHPDDARIGEEGDTHGGYARLDQNVYQTHIDTTFAVALEIGKEVTSSPGRLEQLMGACATDADDSNDVACVQDFISEFGERAHRGPIEPADVAFYQTVYDATGIDEAGIRDVVTVMLTSPQFIYHVEHGDSPDPSAPAADTYRLGAYELANRMSYHFWQSMPDDQLLAAARDGSLLTEQGYRAELDRVFADERTAASLATFFRQWLWLEELPELNGLVGTDLFDNFAGANSPSRDLREKMVEEIERMARYHAIDSPSSFEDMFTSPFSFAVEPELAAIYGVEPWDGAGEPPRFAAGERHGLITRAGLLTTGTANTRPIIKGFQIRKAMLCTTPPPPPDNAADFEVVLEEDFTTRETVEALTEAPGSSCAGCHLAYINGLGFATENYDALGRTRTEQTLFNEAGEIIGSKPVDTVSLPKVAPGDPRETSGASEVSALILESGLVQACFARHYHRFTYGRAEDLAADGCALEDLRQQVISGAPLDEIMKSTALRPEFQRRSFQ